MDIGNICKDLGQEAFDELIGTKLVPNSDF